MRLSGIFLLIAGVLMVPAAPVQVAPVHAAEDAPPTVQDRLKSAVVDAQAKIGQLEPWQKRIFLEEVVPQYQRFIRDYRSTGSGVSVDIDFEGLKRYLAFHAPAVLKRPDLRVLLEARVSPDCAACEKALSQLKPLIKESAERRGFIPVWANEGELDAVIAGPASTFEDRLLGWVKEKNMAGVLLVQLGPIGSLVGDPPSGRRGNVGTDKKWRARVTLLARFDTDAHRLLHSGQVDIGPREDLQAVTAQAVMNFYADLGVKASEWMAKVGGGDELLLEVSGIRDYPHFQNLRSKLAAGIASGGAGGTGVAGATEPGTARGDQGVSLQEAVLIEERRMSRGKVVFALRTTRSVEELRRSLNGLVLDRGQVVVLSEEEAQDRAETLIRAEIR